MKNCKSVEKERTCIYLLFPSDLSLTSEKLKKSRKKRQKQNWQGETGKKERKRERNEKLKEH